MRGEFRFDDGRVVKNNIMVAGREEYLKLMFHGNDGTQVDFGGNFYVGLCQAVPSDALTLSDVTEPTRGINGYARIPVARDTAGFPNTGLDNGEPYIETADIVFAPTGTLDEDITRMFFTPSIGDHLFSNVALQVSNDGVDTGVDFADVSSNTHTLTPAGNAQKDGTLVRYGDTSIKLRGLGDTITAADSATFHFDEAAFTIEFDWRPFDNTGSFDQVIASQWNATGNQRGWRVYYEEAVNAGIRFEWSHNGGAGYNTLAPADLTMVQDTWYHIAISRDSGGVFRMFIDGVIVATDSTHTDTGIYPMFNSTATLIIGATEDIDLDPGLCNVANFRITNGVSRYDTAFVPVAIEHVVDNTSGELWALSEAFAATPQTWDELTPLATRTLRYRMYLT